MDEKLAAKLDALDSKYEAQGRYMFLVLGVDRGAWPLQRSRTASQATGSKSQLRRNDVARDVNHVGNDTASDDDPDA